MRYYMISCKIVRSTLDQIVGASLDQVVCVHLDQLLDVSLDQILGALCARLDEILRHTLILIIIVAPNIQIRS